MNSTKQNSLIEVPPGKYVRAGSGGDGFKEISEPTHGIIVEKKFDDSIQERMFHTVLVDGDLINLWSNGLAR